MAATGQMLVLLSFLFRSLSVNIRDSVFSIFISVFNYCLKSFFKFS